MSLDVYFKQDIANVARALGQNRGSGDFADGYRAALVDVATAFGFSLRQAIPMPASANRDAPRLSCGHPRTSLRHWRNSVSGLTGDWCSECEAERARANAGNGG